MRCKVCGNNGKANVYAGRKICVRCGFLCAPTSDYSLQELKKKWARKHDDIINGHKHGEWAAQPDVML
jgi:hypothetical protein